MPQSLHLSQDDSPVKLTFSLKHRKKLSDRSCVQFYNTQFRKIMQTLKMVQVPPSIRLDPFQL